MQTAMNSEDKIMKINMEKLIQEAARNNKIVIEDPAEENPSFRERMKEYADGLEEKEEEKK